MQAWMNTTMSINNIVVSATSSHDIDVRFIEHFLQCKRNSSFGSLNVKLSPSTLCQLFSNGKIIVVGGKTEEEVRQAFDMYMAEFADLGHPIEYKDYHIQNIVACYKHTENQLGPPRPKILPGILSRTLSRSPLPRRLS